MAHLKVGNILKETLGSAWLLTVPKRPFDALK